MLPGIDSVTADGGQCCLWTRTMPYALESEAALEPYNDKFLIPFISFGEGPAQVKNALSATMGKIGIPYHDSDRAVDAAYVAQKAFRDKLLAAGRNALQRLAETGEPGLVLVGRSYNIYDRNINCDVPRKLRARYGANVIPFDFLATGRQLDGDSQDTLFWESQPEDPGGGEARVREQPASDLYLQFSLRAGCRHQADRPAHGRGAAALLAI